jgi:hypothetical protein
VVVIERGGEKGKGFGIIEEWRDGRVSEPVFLYG